MPGKQLDSQVRSEIREFNQEFLALVCADSRSGLAFGLGLAVRQRLRLLAPGQLEALGETPCLLAGFAMLLPRLAPHCVADAPGPGSHAADGEAARLFAASLLAWLWHTARQDRLLAALCVGPGRLGVERLGSAGFRDLQRMAANATECLEARFCRHPRVWPDLVRAAAGTDPVMLTATRLSIIQLTLISRS
ncbi:MAG: hypothetical protein ABI661_06790 [Gammaproteobacteria bacterium]